MTDDKEVVEVCAREVQQVTEARKYKNPADMRDIDSWQEGKTDLMIILQQVEVRYSVNASHD